MQKILKRQKSGRARRYIFEYFPRHKLNQIVSEEHNVVAENAPIHVERTLLGLCRLKQVRLKEVCNISKHKTFVMHFIQPFKSLICFRLCFISQSEFEVFRL
jgi:hypothetical protein